MPNPNNNLPNVHVPHVDEPNEEDRINTDYMKMFTSGTHMSVRSFIPDNNSIIFTLDNSSKILPESK